LIPTTTPLITGHESARKRITGRTLTR
jgi:hypothetical protein